MKIRAATTFSHEGFHLYGRDCVESFIENWPRDVILEVHHEGMRDEFPKAQNVEYHLLNDPGLMAFKKRHHRNPEANGLGKKAIDGKANFAWNAVRFSHKVFAYAASALREDTDIAIWLDGDVFTHTPVTDHVIESWLGGKMSGFLDRPWLYTETGFHIFDMRYPEATEFFQKWLVMYTNDEIFRLDGWTDCHTYDAVRSKFHPSMWHDLSPPFKHPHPFVNGVLGEHMDHKKGPRKQLGKSKQSDLVVQRQESYWQK